MLSEKMQNALNDQLNAELYSAYLYLAMAAHFESVNLPGFANWMKIQTREELAHAMKFYDYINERGGNVALKAIAEPPAKWKSPPDAFQASLDHEKLVTQRINNLMDLAIEQKDHAARSFLNWFVDEQVEEETSVGQVIEKLKMVKDAPGAMFMLDRELSRRVFTPPPSEGE